MKRINMKYRKCKSVLKYTREVTLTYKDVIVEKSALRNKTDLSTNESLFEVFVDNY